MDGPFNVVVGEAFTFDIDYVEQTLLYMIFGGYLSVCVWKCVWYENKDEIKKDWIYRFS